MTTSDQAATVERTTPLVATRVAKGIYVASNERGGEVRVGVPGAAGSLTPGELMQIAVATCAALSADHVLGSRLGSDFEASLSVQADKVPDENRYARIITRLLTDLSVLDPERREAMLERAERAIDRLCTVGRTLENGAAAEVHFTPED